MNKRTILKEGKLAGLINDELYIAIESQGLNKTKDLYFRSLNEAKDVKSLKWRKANEDERMQYSKHLLKENMERYKRVDRLLKHYNIMYNGHGIETVEKSTVDHPYYQNIDYFYVNMGDPHIETFIYDVTNDKFVNMSLADFIEQREQNINQMDMTNESKKVLKSFIKKVIVEAKSSGENEIEYKGHTIYRYPNWYSARIDGTTKKADTVQALKKQIDEYIKNSKKKK
jgi:hypothetical protein